VRLLRIHLIALEEERFGGEKPIRLSDGTAVVLDSGTCVWEDFSSKGRLVWLQSSEGLSSNRSTFSSEAIFNVARDANRPFIVKTGPLSIRALGTKFDVYRKQDFTRVAVIEGAVKISSDEPSRPNIDPVTALQQLDVPDNTAQQRRRKHIEPGDFERITAWVHGAIQLDQQTLGEVFEEFGRYRHIDVEFKDSEVEEQRFSGVFATTGLDDFVATLKWKCIHTEFDRASQRITVSLEAERTGTACR
jgi:transmembrane sensor